MTAFEQFLHSVQDSFAANRSTSWTKLGLPIVSLAAVSFGLSVWSRRRSARRALATRIESVRSGARLSGTDLDDLAHIAGVSQSPLIDVMTNLASFEQATAKLLAGETPTLHPADHSWFARVARLRKALGFAPLSRHLWLLSTRELVAGDLVSIDGIGGQVVEVNEASFAVDWPLTAILVEGAVCTVRIDRPDDARYRVRVRLSRLDQVPEIATAPGARAAGRRAFFAHDEKPERQQDRMFTRLRANAPVRVQVIDPTRTANTDPSSAPPSRMGTIVDVSAGGMALDLPVAAEGPILPGAHVRCWFTLDSHAAFDALTAVVMAAGAIAGAQPVEQHLRLAFVSLNETERDRLAAAVAQHQQQRPGGPSPSAGSPGS